MPRKASKRAASRSRRNAPPPKRVALQSENVSGDSTSGTKVHIDELPEEMLCHVLSFLDLHEQLKIATVSRRWRQAVDACLACRRYFCTTLIPGLRDHELNDQILEKILSRMPGLRVLDYISNCYLDIDIICRHCPQLETLGVHYFQCDRRALERLVRSCPKLTRFVLPWNYSEKGVETVLRGLPKLRELEVDFSDMTGRFLALLPATLQRLALDGEWDARYDEVARAALCPALKELSIAKLFDPSSEGLIKLLDICPQLEKLDAHRCGIYDPFLMQLPEKVPDLQDLNLSSCRNLTEFGLMNLNRLKELRTLNLFRSDVTDSVLEALEGAPHLTDLTIGPEWWYFTGSTELLVSEERLARLVISCPSLKKMVLKYGMPINMESECIDLEILVQHLTRQLSADRDVTLVVSAHLFSYLMTEVPEDGPLRISVIPEAEEDYH